MTWQKIVGKNLAYLVYWVFNNFGTRTGYTKLIVILILSCLANTIASIAWSGRILVGIIPLCIAGFAIWILDKSYKEKRPILDAFLAFLITLIWAASALIAIAGSGTVLLWFQLVWSLTCTICGIFWFVLQNNPHAKDFNFFEFWPEKRSK